ncbi:putative bifunctional diguanylate cyclase/phosphodiesterase [Pelagibacterium luteolum]|uniref:Diguanylate cyclase (GGDEF) domain-containing protein n=1 Tax=Pelagibacterium luteolum TaxID=440168 RepID=A0A1G8AHA0_9HYPH|nr:bifunctional diguanylate cyclase/phosphodiesterase [Pelagibacterium luteolum]SDH20354.1 diguanylate cyclase (GGDEF) domain-containing protein [Pelagibacterium luteolum]
MTQSRLVRTLFSPFIATAIVASAWLTSTISLGWWAAEEIDQHANTRQIARAQGGIAELLARVPKEQDSSAVWNEAVIAVRANDQDWLAENLVEWLGWFYDHERVYILAPDNTVVRAARDGEAADASAYQADAAVVAPLVQTLREHMEASSAGQEDSTDAIYGLGEAEFRQFSDGSFGLISVRPILPETGEVAQAPGSEYVHVSIEALDEDLLSAIGQKFGLQQLNVASDAPSTPSTLALIGSSGESIGYLAWQGERPAHQLLSRTLPAVILALILATLCFVLLIARLRKTSDELKQSEAEALHLAFHDQLTGIPNRALFEDRLERALASDRRKHTKTALHYIDLDSFKNVNDTLGHPSGDELVKQVAKRLQLAVREVDTVARIGGDEFAIVQIDVAGEADASILGERILSLFEDPFLLHGEEALVGASIGTAIGVLPDVSTMTLMRKADIALYEAKAAGKGRHEIFAGPMDEVVARRRTIEKDLREAINTGTGLALAYQPIFSSDTNTMVGIEALARWNHPVHGALSPEFFITLAEERGLIERFGNWALREAATFAVKNDIPWVAVNVSPVQFRDRHLAQKISAILSDMGLEPNRLQIEVTEGVLLQDSPVVRETIKSLRALGIAVALDDFGTGYSSISYLRSYGVDKLKIDRSFVSKLGIDLEVNSIVQAIIDLARAMKMTVTAEGVETQEQRRILMDMGCAELQGYLLSKPISDQQLAAAYGRRLMASPSAPVRIG